MLLNKKGFTDKLKSELFTSVGKDLEQADEYELYQALTSVIKETMGKNWAASNALYRKNKIKKVYYLSMEYLPGKFSKRNLDYLDLLELAQESFKELGISLNKILAQENDPGLGNGGLGRISAAFLDSLSSQCIPAQGYGLRYEKGLFKQIIQRGKQTEIPDPWLSKPNYWEIKRQNEEYEVRFGGSIEISKPGSKLNFSHQNYEKIKAIPYDIPVPGYRNGCVSTLRLWAGNSYDDLDFKAFSKGNYNESYRKMNESRILTEFLYPDDSSVKGQYLRLKQEYFLVSATVQDIVFKYKENFDDLTKMGEHIAIQINDTHPVLAIVEMMRILLDENHVEWTEAWDITKSVFSLTSHNTMWHASEVWDVQMYKELLPRIWMITEEINYRYLNYIKVEKKIFDQNILERISIIHNNRIHMLRLGLIGSHTVTGVSELHTKVLQDTLLEDFHKIYPEKIININNGVNHRKWLLNSNPKLSNLIEELIGDEYIRNPENLENLLKFKDDSKVQDKLMKIKLENKKILADHILKTQNIKLNPYSIFDVQIDRIHEYKRQLLNILHIVYLYDELLKNPNLDMVPRTFIFAGKAAPNYLIAKDIIDLINQVADRVNNDLTIKNKIKVVFYENLNEDDAEIIIRAADVNQQISTASKEASGTGNIKAMMNGAIILSSLDDDNLEIIRELEKRNIILFGLTPKEVSRHYYHNDYNSKELYHNDPIIKRTMDYLLQANSYGEFPAVFDTLYKYNDGNFVLKDFHDYKKAQEKIGELYRDSNKWYKMSLANIAHSGKFSSDHTVLEYAKKVWHVKTLQERN